IDSSIYCSRPFTLKRWNGCAVWTWDVECDTCAICRLQLMEECLRCQADATRGPEREPTPAAPHKARTAARATGERLVVVAASPPPPPVSMPSSSSSSSAAAAADNHNNTAGSAECVVVWGECSHSFHNCCMSQWVKQNNRCPLCQQ
ncbi:hypothetical protein PENTCL1PPCAC_24993, partial [Pristionchus entomophagus]